MLKKYLKYSAAASLFLFVLDGFVVSGNLDVISWSLLCLAVLYLVHAFFRERSASPIGKVVSVLLLPVSALTNMLLLILLLLCAFNYPPAKPLEPRIKIVQPPAEQTQAYSELVMLLEEADSECYSLPGSFSWQESAYDHSFEGIIPLLDEKCGAERKKLLDVFTAKVTAKPFAEIGGQLGLSISEPMPKYLNLLNLYKIELLDVARLVDSGRTTEAFQKYIFLWQGVVKRLESHDSLINSMVNIATVISLTDLFTVRGVELEPVQIEQLLAIIDEIPERLNSSLAGGLIVEYAVIKGSLLEACENSGTLLLPGAESLLNRALTTRALRWPLFDLNLQLDHIDKMFAGPIDSAYLTGEERIAKLDELKKEMELTSEHPFSLINPVGRILNALIAPSFDGYFARQETAMEKVVALEWLLRSSISKNHRLPPDTFSGDHIVTEKDGPFLKITGDKFSFRVKDVSSFQTLSK